MEEKYYTLIEAIAEWFMQFFFDPMYHYVANSPNDQDAVKANITSLRSKVSFIWKKTRTFPSCLSIPFHQMIDKLISCIQESLCFTQSLRHFKNLCDSYFSIGRCVVILQ